MLYPWHPFYDREVTIHGERNRGDGIVFSCGILDERPTLEVPAWMFDEAACCILRSAGESRVTVEALRSLRSTLNTAADVIKARHQSAPLGGSDAQADEEDDSSVRAVPVPTYPVVTSAGRPEGDSVAGPAVFPACRSKSEDVCGQPSGDLS